MGRFTLSAFGFLLLSACSSSPYETTAEPLLLDERLPPLSKHNGVYHLAPLGQRDIVFYGQREASEVGSNGSAMMYPGADAGSFLVAIAMHAAIQGTVTNAIEQTKIDEANRVLRPFQDAIDSLYLSDLMSSSVLSHLSSESDDYLVTLADASTAAYGWLVTVDPVFIMSRSQDVITASVSMSILDNRQAPRGDHNEHQYFRNFHVQSLPGNDQNTWLMADAMKFKSTMTELIIFALDLGIRDFSGLLPDKQPTAQTIRYLDNGKKRVERGYLISHNCTRINFESLRGEIKSVIKMDYINADSCPQ